MNITAVLGSPHGMKGATGQVLQAMVRGMESAGARVTVLSLTDLKVGPCRACDVCHKTGACSVKDDIGSILASLTGADGIVLASPNYIFSVTAQLKALFDRCCGPLHCQAFSGKYAAAVVTSGGAGSSEVEQYMLRFLRALGCRTVGSVGAEGRQLSQEAARTAVFAQAQELGRQLVEAIQTGRKFPEQDEERKACYRRMKLVVELRKNDWTYEYEYWKAGKAVL